ncbi:MAG: DUF2878 domain-containing protein [Planctomycetota bacterium]|nr:MAG: DUF2878 domain-containing protein [Planctomycetota bacterium]
MYGDSLNPTPPPIAPAGNVPPEAPSSEAQCRVDSLQAVIPQARVKELRPLWVTWFAHPFANWFWFYFGFVAALSGSNMKYPSLGPVVIVGWLTGHLVNAKHPWGEIKLLLASMGMGYVCDSLITLMGVLKFHEPAYWGWPIPLWMAMMWPNFAATLNSSMKWLRGRYQLGAIMGAIAGPFSYYGGVKWGSVDLGWGFWPAMIVIGIEWALAMPVLLWLSARWVPGAEISGQSSEVRA